MRYPMIVCRSLVCGLLFFASLLPVHADTSIRVMTANLTSGNFQKYESPGLHILQGLKPDIVAIQEFNYSNNTPADIRALVDNTFGTNFSYFRESGYNIPNGIISRYPIVESGSWDDPLIPDRGFAWAHIALPETNELYVVSVHLYSSGTADDRNTEALILKNLIQTNFPANAWVIVAGDFNTFSRTEPAIDTFSSFLSDSPIPTDAEAGGDPDTNESRSSPYDYVLPTFALAAKLVPVAFPSHTFSNGLVFDSRVYIPLTDVSPVLATDSAASGMQHMAVVKDFLISTNNTPPPDPAIITQPKNQTAYEGNNVTFTVLANGTPPLTYQWLFNDAPVTGATTNSYTRTNAQPPDAGSYKVAITNIHGSITSQPAALTLILPESGVFVRWDFNSPTADTNTTTGTLSPSIGIGTAAYVGGVTGTSPSAFAGGSPTDTNTTDNSAWNTTAYPAQGTANKTAGVRFQASTVGKRDIIVHWDLRVSNTGSKYARFQYSTNGSAFFDFPSAILVSTASLFEGKTADLSGIAGANNNSNFAFQIVAEFESSAANTANSNYVAAATTYGTGGTLRFDMVTLSGNPLFAPAVLSAPAFSPSQFQFTVFGSTGINYVVESCTNLTNPDWRPQMTNAPPFDFLETNLPGIPVRFYRALSIP